MHVDSDAHVVTSSISTSVGLPQSLRGAHRVSVNLHAAFVGMSVCAFI